MKSGYCTIMWNGRDCGGREMNHHQPHQRPIFIQRKWCVYGGIGREPSIMSSFWKTKWLIPTSTAPNLKAAIEEKCLELVNRKCIIFHQDNAGPHVSLMTRKKLLPLGWEVLIHPPYSPAIAPLDCHLFRSLQNSLNGKNFNSLEDCKRHLEQFFAQKDKKFWEGGIMKVPEKWQKVVGQDGEYVAQ